MTGAQAGIRTDAHYGEARITSIATMPLMQKIDEGRIVVVAGVQ